MQEKLLNLLNLNCLVSFERDLKILELASQINFNDFFTALNIGSIPPLKESKRDFHESKSKEERKKSKKERKKKGKKRHSSSSESSSDSSESSESSTESSDNSSSSTGRKLKTIRTNNFIKFVL